MEVLDCDVHISVSFNEKEKSKYNNWLSKTQNHNGIHFSMIGANSINGEITLKFLKHFPKKWK